MKKQAFTLVELLVVISTIALLLAVLIPSLNKARDAAAMKVCGSNIKQILVAVNMYALETGRLPHSYTDYGKEKQVNLNSPLERYYSWVCMPIDKSGAYVSGSKVNNENEIRGIKAGTIFPYLKTEQVYKCPKDTRSKDGKGGFRTYSLSQIIAASWTSRSYGTPVYRLEDLKRPSERLMVIEEGDPRIFNQGAWQIDPAGKSWRDVIAYWHDRGCEIGLADSHVETFKISDKRTIDYFNLYKDGRETLTSSSPVDDNQDIIKMAIKFNNTSALIR
jgi:competence protein ComGC